ncbi:MAG: sulfatase-like hydrolase/transferase [Planctomycetes bacterium]|nr:sulfatase-like hydrolase/transferase [Planctomycetota bacterium]
MNFIYFNPDEMRADVAACYGHGVVKTPNLDRLAAEGVRYDQCHVQHTVCTPSRCSFMTGWYPHTRGHRTLWHCLRPDEPNTLKYLKQNGYDVFLLGKNDLLAQESYDDSVSRVFTPKSWGKGGAKYDEDDPHYWNFLVGAIDDHPRDYQRVMQAAKLIREHKEGDKPFMIYLPLLFPHCPYHAPEPWHSMYKAEDLPPLRPAELEGKPDFHRLIRRYRRIDEYSQDDLREVMAKYLGMVSYVDYLLGIILDALDDSGHVDDTSLFFFSDHGDWAGDYGLVEKWPSGLDDCLTRIPMVVRTPGNKAGHVVAEPVECFDIVPTTLELAGIELKHTQYGRSMMPQLKGEAGDADRAVFAEGGYNAHEPHCFEGKAEDGVCADSKNIYYPKGLQQQQVPESVRRSTMIRTRSHKLIRRPGGEHELYDMVKDPQELENIFGRPEVEDIQRELTLRMLDWYIETADAVPFDIDPRDHPVKLMEPCEV